jgi:hypothetical protein
MNITETKELVEKIFAIDGRDVTEQSVKSWHGAIGHLTRLDAGTAAKACIQEQTTRIMPAHLIAKVRETLKDKSSRDIQDDGKTFSESAPKCVHKISLLKCQPCTMRLAEEDKCNHGLYPIRCLTCQPVFQITKHLDWATRKKTL